MNEGIESEPLLTVWFQNEEHIVARILRPYVMFARLYFLSPTYFVMRPCPFQESFSFTHIQSQLVVVVPEPFGELLAPVDDHVLGHNDQRPIAAFADLLVVEDRVQKSHALQSFAETHAI